ncbi:MAG: CHASE2 domain-containing protein [Pseudomonadota bacterium]
MQGKGVRSDIGGRALAWLAPGSGRLLLVVLLVTLAAWLVRADPLAPFGRLSWLTYDTVVAWRRPAEQRDSRIVIVDIDEATLQAHGRWPWPRERLAELIDAIQSAGPAMVGLDVLLPEATEPEQDRALARRLAAPEVVTAMAFGDVQAGEAALPRASREVAASPALSYQGEPPAQGHITPELEGDGRIRRLYPYIATPDGEPRAVLALAMLEEWTGLPTRREATPGGTRLCVAGFCQWSTPGQGLLVPYHHPSRFDYLSAAEVLDGRHRERLAGRLVMVGTSAAGLGDLVATPRGALTPGVELHAVLLAGWLDGLAWRPLPQPRAWLLGGLLLLGAVALPLLGRSHITLWQRVLAVSVGAALVVAPPLLMINGWWLAPWAWWGSVAALLVIWLGWERWRLWQRHRRLYRAFGAYVPRSILRQLAEEGGEARFAPQRKPLVILFSDIVGFTAISEQLSPERLAVLTNHIFTELTEVVHAHGGTLDKYLGDALMAFWGAPLSSGEDARLALACARGMQQRLVAINRWAAARGFPPIALHTGMEAGEVTVGNLGSQQRRAYTALGPAVNLAARLEEHAGQIDQPVLIGPGLAEALKAEGEEGLEPFGEVSLKGIRQPVRLWRPGERAWQL